MAVHRNPRRRKASRTFRTDGLVAPAVARFESRDPVTLELVRESVSLTENPNTGKRHTASGGAHYREVESLVRTARAFGRGEYRIPGESPALTVTTPILRARKAPNTTSYTV